MNLNPLSISLRPWSTVRRDCLAALRTVPEVTPFNVQDQVAAAAAQRGCRIALKADEDLRGSASGAVEAKSWGYIIHYDPDPTVDQILIILHELSHIVLGHVSAEPESGTSPAELLGADFPSHLLRSLQLRCGGYRTRQEQEAETLASLILLRATAQAPAELWDTDPELAGLMTRLATHAARTRL